MTECHNILQQDCMPPTQNYYSYIVTMTTQDRPMVVTPGTSSVISDSIPDPSSIVA